MSTALYYNSAPAQWHIDQCQISGEKFNNINEFLASRHQKKFAIIHDPGFTDTVRLEQDILLLSNYCDLVVFLTSEVHHDTVTLIENINRHNVISFICGTLNNNISHKHWMDWFKTSTEFYKQHDILDQLTPYAQKDKTFDILLGQPKPHRTLIYNFARNYGNRVIMTYFTDFTTPIRQYGNKNWIWESQGLEIPESDFNFTVTTVNYYGKEICLSQIVPISIYKQTAYSIICETNFENHYSFFTEKTVKPILGRRLFLMFGGQYQLRNLKNLGFKTFDGIIDESYDNVAGLEERARMIQDQMKYLFEQDQQKILEQIRPITEHNYHHLMTTDWYADFARELRAVLLEHVG